MRFCRQFTGKDSGGGETGSGTVAKWFTVAAAGKRDDEKEGRETKGKIGFSRCV
uniref:Uncharacterized protein n=1 Tax=Nelumbo nucifera TaxID=4432 RepID=A0A822ZBY3_NELNU|nr:TPA_asm: hypothetical protein HUJ06_015302 [Nelumbo nucifera]